jgi:hypothetical protein
MSSGKSFARIITVFIVVFASAQLASRSEPIDPKAQQQGWINWGTSGITSGFGTVSKGAQDWWNWGTSKASGYLKSLIDYTGSLFNSAQDTAKAVARKLGLARLTADVAEKNPLAAAAYSSQVAAKTAEAYAQAAQDNYKKGDIKTAEQLEKVAEHLTRITKRALDNTKIAIGSK